MAETPLDIFTGYRAAAARQGAQSARAAGLAERELTRRELTRDRTAGEIAYDTGAAALQGAVSLGESLYGLGNLATFGGLEAGVGLADNFERTRDIIQGSKSTQLQYQALQNEQVFENEGVLSGVADFATNPALLFDMAVSQVPSILPAAAGGAFAASRVLQGGAARGLATDVIRREATKKATRAAALTGGAQMGGTAYTQVYNQAIAEGLSPDEANARALAAGYATGAAGVAISKLPGIGAAGAEGSAAARVAGVPGAATGFVRQVGDATRREATEEYLQSGAEQMIQNIASERKSLMDGVAKNAALGAVGGGLLGAAMGAVPATSQLRQDIRDIGAQAAEEAGFEAEAKSTLEQRGEQVLQNEAEAQAEAQATIEAATQRLVQSGFVANEDGTFSRPGDLLYGEGPFTLDQALDIAADEDIELDVATDEPVGVAERPAPLPEVDEIPPAGVEADLPTVEVEDADAGVDAYERAYDAITSLGLQERLVDGQRRFELTANGTTIELDETSAIELARQQGAITDQEASLAAQFASEAPVVLPEVSEVTADAVREQQLLDDQDATLARSGFYKEPDSDTFWGVDDAGVDKQFTREDALARVGYTAPDQDLLGDPLFTPIQPVTVEEAATARAKPEIVGVSSGQPQLRGLDPLYDAIDDFKRKQFGARVLGELAQTDPALPAPEGAELRAAWMRVIDGVVAAREQMGQPINYNRAMRNSALITGFVNDAVSQGITPESEVAFDYVAERARAAEASDAKAAGVIAAVADMAGAVEPGTASIQRWRQKLVRSKVAKPGQMRGPAYAKFKRAVSTATITPSSVDYDQFMQAFSESLTEKEAKTTFGKVVREAYPYNPPAVAAAKARTAKVAQQTEGQPKRAKPVLSPTVAPLMKSAREKALTEPTPPPVDGGQEPAISTHKRAVRTAINESATQAETAVASAETQVNAIRKKPRAVDVIEEDDTGFTDRDAAVLDEEMARAEQVVAQQRRRASLTPEEIVEINAIVSDAQTRIGRIAQGFANTVLDLKAAYVGEGATRTQAADGTQRALSEAIQEKMRLIDKALEKDSGDIASWAALTGLVMNNDQFQAYADANTKFREFLSPAISKFMSLVDEARTPDRLRIYRAVLRDTGIEQFVETQMKGQQQVVAKEGLTALNAVIDQNIARMTADPAKPNNVKPFKTNPGKFSTTPDGTSATPMDRAELESLVDEWNLNRPLPSVPFVMYDTVEDAQTALGIAVPASANGIYYDGRAYVIAENVTSREMAMDVIYHERTHAGLEGLLGKDRLNAVMNRVWANAQLRRRTQTKMKRLNLNRVQAAEEVVVDMVVNGEQLNKSIFSKVRAAITSGFEGLFGVRDYVVPDTVVNELLQDTANYVRGVKAGLGGTEGYVDGLDAYMAVFDGKTVPKAPMFSVATSELERFADGETTDVTRFQTAMERGLAESLTRNWKAKGIGTAKGVRRTVTSVTMDFLPASQIADLNRGLFYSEETRTDLLKGFVDDKLAKENEFNKVLQNTRKTYYNYGEQGQRVYEQSAMELAQKWEKLTHSRAARGQADALNRVNQTGTMFKVFPDRAWSEQAAVDYSRENFNEADRRQAYERVRRDWDQMNDPTKDLYRQVQAMYASMWAERMDELRKQSSRIAEASTELPDPDNPDRRIGTGEWKRKMDQKISMAIGRIKQGPYSPLQRFGDFYVVIRDPQGQVVFNSGHDTQADAEAMERSMRDSLGEGYTIATSERDAFVRDLDGISQQHYNQIVRAIEGVFPGTDPTDTHARKHALAAMEEVMLQSLPDSSLLKHANTRKGIAGATMDSFRAFNDYAIKSARNLASMRYDHKIQGALGEMRKFAGSKDKTAVNLKRAQVFSAIHRQHSESQRATVRPWSSFATSVGFMMYMTSPSQLFLNASQTALVSMPVLAARYGIGDTMKYMREAFTEFARSKARGMHSDSGRLDPNSVMAKVMGSLNDDGTLDFTQSHDLSDMAQRESDLMHSRWRRVTHHAGTFMRLSEVYNRETAAYIVVRGEMRKAGMTDQQFSALPAQRQQELLDQWTTLARDAVKETQFIYNQSNKAANMQGNVGRVVFQFQQFRANMLALIYRTVRDSIFGVQDPSLTEAEQQEQTKLARRTLKYMVVTQLAMTGAASSVLAPVVFALMDAVRDEDELLSAEEEFMQAAPQWVSMGLIGQILDPQRFGFDTLIPVFGGSRYMPTTDDPQAKFDHLLLNSLGPMYGIGSQFLKGADLWASGRYADAVPNFLPKPFADALKVLKGRDVEDSQGIAWYERTNYDMVANALGLKTSGQAVAQADRSAIYAGTQRASDRRSALLGRYVMATNASEQQEVIEEVANWNRRWGGDASLVISTSTLTRAVKTRREKELNAQRYGVPSTRTPETVRRLVDD